MFGSQLETNFPDELRVHILKYCPVVDIFRAYQVNAFSNNKIDSLLQYDSSILDRILEEELYSLIPNYLTIISSFETKLLPYQDKRDLTIFLYVVNHSIRFEKFPALLENLNACAQSSNALMRILKIAIAKLNADTNLDFYKNEGDFNLGLAFAQSWYLTFRDVDSCFTLAAYWRITAEAEALKKIDDETCNMELAEENCLEYVSQALKKENLSLYELIANQNPVRLKSFAYPHARSFVKRISGLIDQGLAREEILLVSESEMTDLCKNANHLSDEYLYKALRSDNGRQLRLS